MTNRWSGSALNLFPSDNTGYDSYRGAKGGWFASSPDYKLLDDRYYP